MPRTFRHSLLVALMLGFISARRAEPPLPHLSPQPRLHPRQLPRTPYTNAWEATTPSPPSPTTSSAAWSLIPKRAASLWA